MRPGQRRAAKADVYPSAKARRVAVDLCPGQHRAAVIDVHPAAIPGSRSASCVRGTACYRMPRYVAPGPLAVDKRIAERLFFKTYDLELQEAQGYRIWAYRNVGGGRVAGERGRRL